MAIVFNESEVARESFGTKAYRQRLITDERMRGTHILLDRLSLEAGSIVDIEVPASSVVWFHVVQGEATWANDRAAHDLSNDHVVFLSPGEKGVLKGDEDTVLLYVEIPDVGRVDSDFSAASVRSNVLDWTREPVLDSKHDARKRIYMATPKLFGTRAIKCEMIVYPPNTSGSNHRHEGAEHLKYVLQGKATGYADDVPHSLKKGDVVYHPAGEWHYSLTESDEQVTFIEFFVPGQFTTVWATDRVCSWGPTGKNVRGEKPVREIAFHSSDQAAPDDV